jgi:hypothetical protein
MISKLGLKSSTWQNILLMSLLFWLSSSLLLDFVIMPSLYASGMMVDPQFPAAGYSLFWIFNRLELLCGAVILTSLLVRWQGNESQQPAASQTLFQRRNVPIAIALVLLAIAGIYTYFLAPEMSSLGLQLHPFDGITEFPAAMDQLHGEYGLLEIVKLLCAGTLLKFALQDRPSAASS